jgi:glucokinase
VVQTQEPLPFLTRFSVHPHRVADLLQTRPTRRNLALIADIGGSTSRFALAEAGGPLAHIAAVANDSHASLEDAIAWYLDGIDVAPHGAVLAVAGPVDGNEIALTNRSWRFRTSDVAARFRFGAVKVVNDFEAVAWAVLGLMPDQMQPLGPVPHARHGVRVVLGPGTGLGIAALVPDGRDWHVVASEGGHVSFGPGRPDEEAPFERLRVECGTVSAETVLSGAGLERLYRAVNPEAVPISAESIVANARAGNPQARATTDLFGRLLGRFAGDAALMFKATGGVYITGGVALGLGPLIDAAAFREAFEAHPPYERLLAGIPTRLMTCREPGLLGCAALVERMAGTDAAK